MLVAMTHTSDHAIPLAVQTEGTSYHKLTHGQSGHKHGPPGPWLIPRCAIAAHEAAATKIDNAKIRAFVEQFCTPPSPSEAVIAENVAKYPSKTPSEFRDRTNILEAANTRVRIAQ